MKESTKAYLVDIYNSIPKKNKGYLLKILLSISQC